MRGAWTGAVVAVAAILIVLDGRATEPVGRCAARVSGPAGPAIAWRLSAEDADELDRWCRAVGPPVIVSGPREPAAGGPPRLDDLVLMTWNAHLAEGRLASLVAALQAGQFTDGAPVRHFVLLLQELYRRGPDVPAPSEGMRSAFAIKARRPDAPDAAAYARTLGLSFVYVPSMRNGADVFEDRGNAVISTEPFTSLLALELPLARQRRVAIGVTVNVATRHGVRPLLAFDAHLEPLSSPKTLWLFRNPRPAQLSAVLRTATEIEGSTSAGTVLGGDFNTIQGGTDEPVYALARAWSRDLDVEDPRPTHRMGRLDYLFFKGSNDWKLSTTRIDDRFGSDHRPVMGRFSSQ